jgi:DNA-directed RNA polymerase omega subunit
MQKISREALDAAGGCRNTLITMASFRAHMLQHGATPLIETKEKHKPTVLALMEIEQGAYTLEHYHNDRRPKTDKDLADEYFPT